LRFCGTEGAGDILGYFWHLDGPQDFNALVGITAVKEL
jgi:hypothetical protein